MIPFQLKFGAEKSRIVILIIFGFIAVISFFLAKVVGTEFLYEVGTKIDQLDDIEIITGIAFIVILSMTLSYIMSCRSCKKKNFNVIINRTLLVIICFHLAHKYFT